MKRGHLAFFIAFCSMLVGCASSAVEVYGHRGARALYPENTLPAFKHALEAGADFLELDLGVTKDGHLVVCHDSRLNPEIHRRIDGRPMPRPAPLLQELSLAQVKGYDAGSLRHPRFPRQQLVPGTRIPTLEEVFALVAQSVHPTARRIRFNIETKIDPARPGETVGPNEFTTIAIAAFRKSGFFDRIVLQSFDPRTLELARRIAPKLTRSLLVEDAQVDMLVESRRVGAEIVSPNFHLLTPTLVARLHAAGLRVIPWTANQAAEWEKLRDLKVDGIITDDPAGLLKFMGR